MPRHFIAQQKYGNLAPWINSIEANPADEGEGGGGGGGGAPDTTNTPDSVLPADKPDEEIQNPQGVLNTLRKFQQYGSLNDIQKMAASAKRLEALEAAISAEGADLSKLPETLKQMREAETKQTEFKEQYEAQLAIAKAEFDQQLAEANKRASDTRQELLDERRSAKIQPFYNANAKPEALGEWGSYWAQVQPYIQFEENGTDIKGILGPDMKPMYINKEGEDVRPAKIEDLFNAFVEGKYGFFAQAALKPISAATGGGILNPASTPGLNRIKRSDLGKLSPTELAAAKAKIKSGELTVV